MSSASGNAPRTVGVDFDGTLSSASGPLPDAIAALRFLMGPYAVFVQTTKRRPDVASVLEPHGFDVTTDDRCPDCQGLEELDCGICHGAGLLIAWHDTSRLLVTPRKLAAFCYIDDRGLRFGNWRQALGDLAALAALADFAAAGGQP